MATAYCIEIATSDFATTAAAVRGGADRIELCANLGEGGTTPSYGTIATCRETFSTPLYPIIRPRGGDFLYTDEEHAVMLKDIAMCKQIGCDGIVIGGLQKDGNIDPQRVALWVQKAYPLKVTFHRAFDRCRDPFLALEQLIEAGCERILTSGLQPQAMAGAALIQQFQEAARNRIIIMPGSGVRQDTILPLAQQTGCTEFHASLRSTTASLMAYKNPSFVQSSESYQNNYIDEAAVRLLKKTLMEYAADTAKKAIS